MVAAIVWDMGSVFVKDEPPTSRQLLESRLGLASGELAGLVFHRHLAHDLIVGKEDPSTMWRSISDDLGLSSQEVDDLSRGFWGEPVSNDGVFGLIDSNQSEKHAVLSDAWMGTREIMRPRINNDLFDTVMFSAEESIRKPGAEIFLRMSSRLGMEPTRILFVDDRIENVKGARAVGMKATQFTDTPDVFEAIETSLRDAE